MARVRRGTVAVIRAGRSRSRMREALRHEVVRRRRVKEGRVLRVRSLWGRLAGVKLELRRKTIGSNLEDSGLPVVAVKHLHCSKTVFPAAH